MVKELVHDPIFLAGKSEIATKEDLPIAQDLLDTLIAHREGCVGKAANMIGVRKRIVAFLDEGGHEPQLCGDFVANPSGNTLWQGEMLEIKPAVEESFLG